MKNSASSLKMLVARTQDKLRMSATSVTSPFHILSLMGRSGAGVQPSQEA